MDGNAVDYATKSVNNYGDENGFHRWVGRSNTQEYES